MRRRRPVPNVPDAPETQTTAGGAENGTRADTRTDTRTGTRAATGGRVLEGALARIAAARRWVLGLSGWRRYGFAFALGVSGAGALPPFYAGPLLILTCVGAIWLLDAVAPATGDRSARLRSLRQAAGLGWWLGFGFHLAGLYWVGFAFLVEAETFAWLMPFAVVLLPAGLALIMAACFAAASLAWRPDWRRVLIFALAWLAQEWLRGHILTGFPWNLVAYSWAPVLPMVQTVSLIGSYGLGLLTIFCAGAFATLGGVASAPIGFAARHAGSPPLPPLPPRAAMAMLGPPAAAGLLLAACLLAGFWRLAERPAPAASVHPGIDLVLIQPSIPQAEKSDPALRDGHWEKLLRMSVERSPGAPGQSGRHQLIIWPEAALPYLLQDPLPQLRQIAAILGPRDRLVTGAVRVAADESGAARFRNALYIFDSEGRVSTTYDKHHLVPFGEYLPLSGLLEALGLRNLVPLGSMEPGPGHRVIREAGIPPFGPLICYEAIFPGAVKSPETRPEWLLNITDDSWFGPSTGPRQHFRSAQYRAVEEGLPLVRVANNGISAVIDPYGETIARTALDHVTRVQAPLPKAVPATLYGRIGDWSVLVLLALVLLPMGVLTRLHTKL